MPLITFGIAHHEDFHGAYFTLQNIRLQMKEMRFKDYELVVIDNSPTSKHSDMLRDLIAKMSQTTAITYVAMNDRNGTTQTRNEIFVQAKGDWVVVMDCHVLLPPQTIKSLMEIIHPSASGRVLPSKGIFSGPMIHDTLDVCDTHFNDEWRADMWGTWGSTWMAPNGKLFSPYEVDGLAQARTIEMQPVRITKEVNIPHGTPASGFHQWATANGFKLLSPWNYQDLLPEGYMPIPGMGLGMFFCRRSEWVGFNPHFRGFGGEEMYIHEKFRQHGGEAYCVFNVPWLHRFGRPEGHKYQNRRYDIVRNYILGHDELNRPKTEPYDHFVNSGKITKETWDLIASDPVNRELPAEPAEKPGCKTCGQPKPPPKELTLAETFEMVVNVRRDLNEHALALRELARSCRRITEFTKRRESSVIWANAQPDILTTYWQGEEPMLTPVLWQQLNDKAGRIWNSTKTESSSLKEIDECDLLWIDTVHTADRLAHELKLAVGKVKRYIVIRGTGANGEQGEGGGPGLMPAIRQFLTNNTDWQMKDHWPHQYGITVLSCLQEDVPKLPSTITMMTNYAKAMATHAANGFEVADEETVQKRLAICEVCPAFINKTRRCSVCGCPLEAKATQASSSCPVSKW